MSNLKPQKCSSKFIRKTLAVILVGVFLSSNTYGWAKEEELFLTGMGNNASSSSPADNSKLAPPLRLNNDEFKQSLTIAAICKHIEHDGNLDDKSYLNDVLARLDAEKNSNITVLSDEIIIEIPSEGLAVRYFDPTKANVITPYSDISKLSTKVIGPRLNRQIIHRIKALSVTSAIIKKTGNGFEEVNLANGEVAKLFDDLMSILASPDVNDDALAKCVASIERIVYDSKIRPKLNNVQRKILFDALLKTHNDKNRESIASCICISINSKLILQVTNYELGQLLEALTRIGNSKETNKIIALCIGWALRLNHDLLPNVISSLINSDVAMRRYITMAFEHAVTDKSGPILALADVQNVLDVLNKDDNTNETRQSIVGIMTFVLAHNSHLKLTDSQLRIILDRNNRAMWTEFVVEHALYNNPDLITIVISKISNPEPFDGGEWLIDILSRNICQSDVRIAPDAILLFTNVVRQETKARVFNMIIEPLFFKQPNLFTTETIKALEYVYAKDVPEFKYLIFYAGMREATSPASSESLFPYQKSFKKLMLGGRKNVLVVHNINDGLGDELIRNSTLIQALLDSNPELEVTLYTSRPFLYDHPRIKVKEIVSRKPFMSDEDKFDLKDENKFDMIINHYDRKQKYSDSFEAKFRTYLTTHRPKVYINYDKNNDNFVPKEVTVDNKTVQLAGFEKHRGFMPTTENVYAPTFRLCAELGLSFRHGTKKSRESIFTSLPNPAADTYWENVVTTANVEKRPIIVINGFGGEDMEKGYSNGKSVTNYDKADEDDFRKMLQKLISEGFFVIVLPNGKWYGTPNIANDIIGGLSTDEKRFALIAPDPSENPKLHKHLISHNGVAMAMTIEGGLMHLSYNMGVPFSALLMKKSGYMLQWLPIGMDNMQGYSALQYGDRVNRRDSVEGFIVPASIQMAAFGMVRNGSISKKATEEETVSKLLPPLSITERQNASIAGSKTLFRDMLGADKPDTLVRVPVEAIESIGVGNIKDFLATFQKAPNGYVELYYMSGVGEASENVYQRYGLQKKPLPKDFKRTRESTVTLFPALKGEEVNQSAIVLRLGNLSVTPDNTILSPIGLQRDPAGLIRATILGLKMMDVARQIKEKGIGITKDQAFKDKIQLEILEQLKNVCDTDDLKSFNLTPDDIIALATGTINNIVTALKKLIKLLPITPISIEELRQIYEHARKALVAA